MRSGQVMSGQGKVGSGQVRSDQVKSGHIWTVQDMSSQSQVKLRSGKELIR